MLFQEGLELREAGDNQEALALMEQALDSGYDDVELLLELGATRREVGDYFGAIDLLKEATEREPNNFEAWYNLAEAYHNTGEDQYKDEAHWAMDHALELEPDNPDAHWLMGMIRYFQYNNPDEAIQDLSRAIELRPDYALFYNVRGVIFLETGQWEECVADYNEFATLDPANPYAYFERGLCYQGLGDGDRVRENFERFLDLSEGNPEFDQMRGEASRWLDEN